MPREKILLIDDEVDIVRVTELRLLLERYEVTYAYSGAEGIQKAIAWKPDLVIVDIVMPDIDGFEVCRRLKALPETKHIPVLLFSAKGVHEAAVRAVDVGADGFVEKPHWPPDLIQRVRRTLEASGGKETAGA